VCDGTMTLSVNTATRMQEEIVLRSASRVPSYTDNEIVVGVEVEREAIGCVTELDGATSRIVLNVVGSCLEGCSLKRCISTSDHERVISCQYEVTGSSSLYMGRERVGSRSRKRASNG